MVRLGTDARFGSAAEGDLWIGVSGTKTGVNFAEEVRGRGLGGIWRDNVCKGVHCY